MAKPRTADEREDELNQAMTEAFNGRFSRIEPSPVSGAYLYRLEKPIRLATFGVTMQCGTLMVLGKDAEAYGGAAPVRGFDTERLVRGIIDEENRMKEAGLAEDIDLPGGGVATMLKGDGAVVLPDLDVQPPLRVPDRETPISLNEAAGWAAINDAMDAGDQDKAQRLFRTLYGIHTQEEVTEVPSQRVALLDKTARNLGRYELNDTKLDEEDRREFEINVTGANERTQRIVKIALSLKDAKTSETLTPYELVVCGAAMSFYHNDRRQAFTAAAVWKAVTGGTRKPRPNELKEIDDAIEKMRHVDIKTNFTDEMKRLGIDVKAEFRGYLLPLDVSTFTHPGGKT